MHHTPGVIIHHTHTSYIMTYYIKLHHTYRKREKEEKEREKERRDREEREREREKR